MHFSKKQLDWIFNTYFTFVDEFIKLIFANDNEKSEGYTSIDA